MTDPLLTLVARAIERPFLPHGYELKPHLLKAAAQAALSVIREQELTEAMIEAGVSVMMEYPDGTDLDIPEAVVAIYRAMQAARPLPAPPLEKM